MNMAFTPHIHKETQSLNEAKPKFSKTALHRKQITEILSP